MDQSRVGRPLAAILVADVVGYSRLVAASEAAARAAVESLHETIVAPLVAAYTGRLVERIDDVVIAEFDTPTDAVACAIALQNDGAEPEHAASAARLLVLRVAVEAGPMSPGGGRASGNTIIGATRLLPLCEAGGVVVSDLVREEAAERLGDATIFLGEAAAETDGPIVRAWGVRLGRTPRQLHRHAESPSSDSDDRLVEAEPVRRPRPAPAPMDVMPDDSGLGWAQPGRRLALVAAAAMAVLALSAGLGLWLWPKAPAASADRPVIAVLPFRDLSGNDAGRRLARGLTQDTITDLTRYRDFDVIAWNSVKDLSAAADPASITKNLAARYMLRGSVGRSGDSVRLEAALIAGDGSTLWSDSTERPAADVFSAQAEFTDAAARAIAGSDRRLAAMQPAPHRKPPTDPDAYDLIKRADEASLKATEADAQAGIALADQAIARDPNFARAYIQKGLLVQDLTRYSEDWNAAADEIADLARSAIQRDPNDAAAHILLASALETLNRRSEAVEETDRALEINPSSADIINLAADSMPYRGDAREGAAMCDRAFRLNPTPPDWYWSHCAANYFFRGRYDEAVAAVDRGIVGTGDPTPAMLAIKAGGQAELDDSDDAAKTIAQLEDLYWEVSFEWLLNTGWTFERERDRDRILNASRKAGLRICATEDELADFPTPVRLEECKAEG